MSRCPRRGFRHRATGALTVLALLSGATAACSQSDDPRETVVAFLQGWRGGNLDAVGFVGPDGAAIPAQQVLAHLRGLSGELVDTPPELRARDDTTVTGDIAATPVDVTWALGGQTTWSYPSTVRLTRRDSEGWRVIWEPTIVHQQLVAGDRLAVRRVAAARAAVLDGAGRPLVSERPVVVVGVDPAKATDLTKLTKGLTAAFATIGVSVDLKGLKARVEAAAPGAVVDLVTLRRPDYDKIRDRVRPLPGTAFVETTRQLAPTRTFARALLGTVDEATLEDLESHPDRYARGDLVGHGGVQQRYDTRLRGTPGRSVVIARKAPGGRVTDTPVFRSEPAPGAPVRTTLDVATQQAADAAVATEKRRSALVAVRISDSAVLAVANGPDGGTVDLASTAQVPPGSTFKMVSTLGLLDKKAVSLDARVDCPKTRTVDGRAFRNAHDMQLGPVPFRTVFAKSCNTAFAGLAPALGADGLAAVAGRVGIGTPWDVGSDAFSGKVSTGGSPAEQAAASFGQGATVVSPLAMAGATAAVARGTFQQPRLVVDPAPAKPAPPGPALPADAVAALRTMMREVVTKGTGTALADVPGGPVHGKTGTAEFATGSTETHAWFIGWQRDIAFAVFVEKGGAGSDTAVPIAERFLRALAA